MKPMLHAARTEEGFASPASALLGLITNGAAKSFLCVVCLAVFFQPTTSKAIILDWDSVTWVNSAMRNTTPSVNTYPGVRVTVTPNFIVGPPTGTFVESTPKISNDFRGGTTPVENSLTLKADFGNIADTITVTFEFLDPAGVRLNPFNLFDIDAPVTSLPELVTIKGFFMGSQVSAPTLTTSSANILLSPGTVRGVISAADTGSAAATSAGNVGVNFGSTVLDKVEITFGLDQSNPQFTRPQDNNVMNGFAIHDLNFTVVPEVNPAWAGLGLGFIAFGARALRRKLAAAKQNQPIV